MAELNLSSGKNAGRHSRKRAETRVDLTAMVDLAFLLITFFMLTTTMTKPKMVPVVMPEDEPVEQPLNLSEKQTVTVVLGNYNRAISYLGMTEKPLTEPKITGYNKDGLRKALVEQEKNVKQATGKAMFVIIKPGSHADYENLVNTLDEIHIAGAVNYAIENITPKEIALLKQMHVY